MLSILAGANAAWSPPQEVADAAKGSNWAVLVAGSSSYGNYRHQSDVCHAYQIMKSNGIADDKIIVLATDDIANNPSNPYPGQMFNKPTAAGTPGVDVYAGCKIDYSGTDVTPEMFVKVLTGDDSAGGKVLKSTKKDRVFVNFVDHGGVNIIGFPRTTMHATELVGALTTMHSQSMYKELVFYLEACESGSMFETLPADIKIYATTAANAHESSWGTYCMPDDKVDGKSIGSCLGDLYSVTWMEDTDKAEAGETIGEQTTAVTKLTTKSHVTVFGEKDIEAEKILNFEGASATTKASWRDLGVKAAPHEATSIRSENAALASAFHRFAEGGDDEAGAELIAGVQARMAARATFDKITTKLTGKGLAALPRRSSSQLKCHYEAHKAYVSKCGEWHEMALSFSATLADLCEHQAGKPEAIVAAIGEACVKA